MLIKPRMTQTIYLKNSKAMPLNLVSMLENTKGHMNVEFVTKEENYKLQTVNSHTHFEVYKKDTNGHWVTNTVYYILDDYMKFADMVLNFTPEAITQFTKDQKMELKYLIDNMTAEQRDHFLFGYMLKDLENRKEEKLND